nr:putative ribonuclease H-like domain-containing protein [Tanacetum cinerariifolium]
MDSLSPQVVSAIKLPILNPNEFDLWKMRIEQYFLMTDYSLWEVILNGDSHVPTRIVEGVPQPVAPTTAEQRLARKNELKARGTLLMALPDKHQLKFNSHKDAKTLMEAIEKRFCLDQIHDRLQKLVSQLEIHGVSLFQEDVNLKFLRSLPSEWKTHTLIWINKADLEEQNLDDLFNSLKIYETEVKHSSSPGTATQNLAFVSSTSTYSTTDSVSAAASVSATCVKLPGSPLPNVDSLSKNIGANGPTSMGFDMSKVECYNCQKKRHFAKKCRSPKDSRRPSTAEPQRRTVSVETSTSNALVSQCDGLESVEARLLVYKQNESVFEENIKLLNIEVQLRDTALITLRQKLEKAEQERDDLKLKLEKFQTLSKKWTDLLASQTNEKTGLGYSSQVFTKAMFDCENYYSLESDSESWPPSNLYDRFQPSGGYHVVLPPYTGTFMPPKPDLVFNTAPTAVETGHLAFNVQLNTTKPPQDLSHTSRPSAPIIEDWVSDSDEESETKVTQFVPSFAQSSKYVKTPRHSEQPIETTFQAATTVSASPKSNSSGKRRNRKDYFVCKSVDHLIKDCNYHTKKMAQPTPRNYAHRGHHKQYASLPHLKPQTHRVPTTVLTKSKLVLNTAVRPVSAARPNIPVTRSRNAHQVVIKSKSPIRRHITRNPSSRTSNSPLKVNVVQVPMVSVVQGNMSYLSDFEELNGGYVAFRGNPKGGKITGKGKIRTGKLDFDDVYFVKELKFNLFSVLFTDTKCLVLSSDFKLPDASQVLLRVPRENNMYNVNLKNIVPSRNLTCLFAKATLDESNLWHRRLAHVNFKTINKLVKGNLVRGLPTKVFENYHTCVACRKGKQHKALFLNKKRYCLVITDDYSRFTWVFFLATKDETSPILKTFLTGLENQLSLKVKVIRSDNGTEFKNSDLNQFCGVKGIKREFSVPRTPQQNGIAERKNRTLIEAARTMLADSLLRIPFWAEAVNTACYVHNRVLVTKPHNKTPYELLHGRTPSIGPTWLFDIDSLTRTMNYQPVYAENQTNSGAGFQDNFDAEKAGEEVGQSYMLFPMWSTGFTNPQNNAEDVAFDGKEHDFDTKKEAKGKSPVESVTRYRDLDAEFQDCSENSSNEVTTASYTIPTVGQNFLNNTNTFGAVGPSNTAVSPTYGKTSDIDASQLPDDPDMPGLEDIIYSDDEDVVGVEADFNNLESSIPVSPIPTTRTHKDHP